VAPDGDLIVLGGSGSASATLGLFIEKVDGDLNLIWRHTFGLLTGGSSSIPQPAVLADGTVVFAVNGIDVMFDSGELVLNSTANILTVLVALSSAGTYQWIKTYPQPLDATEDQISLAALAANPGGGVSVAGQVSGQVNLDFAGGAAGMVTTTASTVFIAQYDVTAKLGLVKTYSSSPGAGSSILLDATGFTPFLGVAPDSSMYLAGGFMGVGAFGSSTAPYPGTQFIAHLGAGGSLTAAGSWVDTPSGVPPSLALASDGSMFQSSNAGFARLDATTGQPQWSFPTPAWSTSHLAARASVVVVGDFEQAMDFDFGPGQALYQPQGPSDAPYPTSFMAGYDEAGQLQWVREPTIPTNNAVTIGLDGAIYYLNGGTQSLTDLDPGPGVDPMLAPIGTCYITKYAAP
jgi:outer membrane protein assembly factor BamB